MSRWIWVILFFIVLLTPFALRWAVGVAPEKSGRTAAPAGDAKDLLRVVVITPHAETIRTEFSDAFAAWHREKFARDVFVDYRVYGGSTDIVRYFDNAHRTLFRDLGTYQIDVVWGGGDDLFDRQLKQPGYLEGVKLSDDVMRRAFAQPAVGGLPLYDQKSDPPQWYGTALSSFGIVFNRDVLAHLNLPEPKTWSDLTDPTYRRWVLLADPTRSGVARTTFMVVVERSMQDAADAGRSADEGWARGMGLIRQIAANARNFSDGSTAVSGIVGSGEAAAGMAIDFHARSQVDAVLTGSGSSRLGYVEPVGATAINPDPIALVKGAENRAAAVRFIEFVLSEAGQRLWNTRAGAPGGPKSSSLRRLPVMQSLYTDVAAMRDFTDQVNPYVAGGDFNTSRDRTVTSGILSELIQASCIDPLDELRDTRAAILASPRAGELDARLGVFPFGQTEALERMKRYRAASPLERLTLQRQWTEEFRAEYRRLREEAEREPRMNADEGR